MNKVIINHQEIDLKYIQIIDKGRREVQINLTTYDGENPAVVDLVKFKEIKTKKEEQIKENEKLLKKICFKRSKEMNRD